MARRHFATINTEVRETSRGSEKRRRQAGGPQIPCPQDADTSSWILITSWTSFTGIPSVAAICSGGSPLWCKRRIWLRRCRLIEGRKGDSAGSWELCCSSWVTRSASFPSWFCSSARPAWSSCCRESNRRCARASSRFNDTNRYKPDRSAADNRLQTINDPTHPVTFVPYSKMRNRSSGLMIC